LDRGRKESGRLASVRLDRQSTFNIRYAAFHGDTVVIVELDAGAALRNIPNAPYLQGVYCDRATVEIGESAKVNAHSAFSLKPDVFAGASLYGSTGRLSKASIGIGGDGQGRIPHVRWLLAGGPAGLWPG
jgi:hypothetical protein